MRLTIYRTLLIIASCTLFSNISLAHHLKGINQEPKVQSPKRGIPPATKDLCNSLKTILNESLYDFEGIKGKIDTTDNFYVYYDTHIKIPGAKECYVRKSNYGTTYFSVIGTYYSKESADHSFSEFLGDMKSCLPDYYFDKDTTESAFTEILFGHKTTDGYDREAGSLRLVSKNDTFHIYLFFEKGARLHFSYNKPKPVYNDTEFKVSLEKLMISCKTGFKDDKGAEKPESFSSRFDTRTGLPGARETNISTGTGKTKYEGIFYTGENEKQAKDMYHELIERVKNSLTTDYVYTETEPEMSELLNTVFGQKSSRSYDYIPAISVKLSKNGSVYEVKLVIAKESI